MEEKIKDIVNQVLLISQKEKILKQEKFKRGDCFNIFEIMRAQHDEVTTHSAMLASLLNPNGSHGAGCAFLDLFMEHVVTPLVKGESSNGNSFSFDMANSKTKVEYQIGDKTNDFEEGGRIDILIENENSTKAIIIENKIYAGDQKKQLYRYYKFAEKYGPGNYILLYLTLDGHEPSEESIKSDSKTLEKNKDFYCISYADDIAKWIGSCREKAAARPVVRETMTQYLDLILKLTNQNMENTTKEELVKYLAKRENYDAAFKIHEVYDAVRNEILNTELERQVIEIAEKEGMILQPEFPKNENWCKAYEGQFSFYKPEWETFCICFEFMSDGLKNFNYGIKYRNENLLGTKPEVINNKAFSNYASCRSSKWYVFYKPFPIQDWNDETIFEKLFNGKIKELIEEKVKELKDLLDNPPFDIKIKL